MIEINNSNSTETTTSVFIVALVIAIIFMIFKFFEMRFLTHDDPTAPPKPLKVLIRDTLAVYICALLGQFLIAQFAPIEKVIKGDNIKVFTNQADF